MGYGAHQTLAQGRWDIRSDARTSEHSETSVASDNKIQSIFSWKFSLSKPCTSVDVDRAARKTMEAAARRAAERHQQDELEWQQLQSMQLKHAAAHESCDEHMKAFLAARACVPERRLQSFLEEHGFEGVNSKRRKLLRVCYPLHVAVKQHDSDMVKLLLQAQADPSKKNSSGETPYALAQKHSKQGLSDPILVALHVHK
jgi:hypothetical protein